MHSLRCGVSCSGSVRPTKSLNAWNATGESKSKSRREEPPQQVCRSGLRYQKIPKTKMPKSISMQLQSCANKVVEEGERGRIELWSAKVGISCPSAVHQQTTPHVRFPTGSRRRRPSSRHVKPSTGATSSSQCGVPSSIRVGHVDLRPTDGSRDGGRDSFCMLRSCVRPAGPERAGLVVDQRIQVVHRR